MTEIIVLYSLSSKGSMIPDALASVKSLRKKSKSIPVTVVNTPPYMDSDAQDLFKKRDVEVFFKPNETDPITIGHRTGRYMEKLAVLGLYDIENVIFLDCDTLVKKNIRGLLEGSFDFSARVAPSNLYSNWVIYSEIFQDLGVATIPLFNSGVMVFKNGFAGEISQWALSLGMNNFKKYNAQDQIDQLAVTLAVSMLELSVKYMTPQDHGFRWLHESNNCTVYHGSKKYLKREILRTIRGLYRYVS